MSKTSYWTKVIDRAIAKADAGKTPFTNKQINRSADWVTCACGKQNPRLNHRHGSPIDSALAKFGVDFTLAVQDQNPLRAGGILLKIEKRAATLLKEIAPPMDNDQDSLEMAIATIRHGAEHPQGAFMRQALCVALKDYLDDLEARLTFAEGFVRTYLQRLTLPADKGEVAK